LAEGLDCGSGGLVRLCEFGQLNSVEVQLAETILDFHYRSKHRLLIGKDRLLEQGFLLGNRRPDIIQ